MKLGTCACRRGRGKCGVVFNTCHWLGHVTSSRSALTKDMLSVRMFSFEAGGEKPKSNEELVKRMRQKINDDNSSQQQRNAWDSLWKDGTTPWDLGKPTPALISELKTHWRTSNQRDTFNKAESKKPFRTLVPGCGAGYDLVTLARHHDNWFRPSLSSVKEEEHSPTGAVVVGLDVSETSLVERASAVVAAAFQDSSATAMRWTRVDLVQGDFFGGKSSSGDATDDDTSWKVLRSYGAGTSNSVETSLYVPNGSNGNDDSQLHFDFIFDYTFFCALPPSLRSAWGARTAELLTPDTGRLLTIIFPILESSSLECDDDSILNAKTSAQEGPPYPVTVQAYRDVLEPHGVFIVMDDDDASSTPTARVNPDTVPARAGKELVCWWSRQTKGR